MNLFNSLRTAVRNGEDFIMAFKDILLNLPEVAGPTQKKLGFQEKLKWTLLILILFFIMGIIPLFGLGENALAQFEYLQLNLNQEIGLRDRGLT